MVITPELVVRYLERLHDAIAEHCDDLTRLDAAIGDADHGTNLERGFEAVVKKLPELAERDVGTLLKTVGMTLISTVGGASGPLYGTGFMRAGMALVDHHEVTAGQLVQAWAAALAGVEARGRSQPGEKTMVDAMAPAVEALRAAVDGGADLMFAVRAPDEGARAGMLATIPMRATKGRASYLGERSVGHQDPGATSTHLMVRVLREVLESAT